MIHPVGGRMYVHLNVIRRRPPKLDWPLKITHGLGFPVHLELQPLTPYLPLAMRLYPLIIGPSTMFVLSLSPVIFVRRRWPCSMLVLSTERRALPAVQALSAVSWRSIAGWSWGVIMEKGNVEEFAFCGVLRARPEHCQTHVGHSVTRTPCE